MRILVLLIIGAFSICVFSCRKDDTNTQGTTTSAKDTVDYRIKFAGNYKCIGVNTFISDSTRVVTREEFFVTSVIEITNDSTMRFVCDYFNIGKLVRPSGVITAYNSSLLFGKFTNGGDSLYLNDFTVGHIGTSQWEVAGKKQQ